LSPGDAFDVAPAPAVGGADATVVDRSTVFPLVESEATSPELT